MRTSSLTLAILLGISSLNMPLFVSSAYAEEVQSQNPTDLSKIKSLMDNYEKAVNQLSHQFITVNPMISSAEIHTSDYQVTSTGADAESTFQITLLPQHNTDTKTETVSFHLKDTFEVNEKLKEQGIIARLHQNIVVDDALKQFLNADNREIAKIGNALNYLEMTIDFLDNDDMQQTVKIKPFTYQEGNSDMQFSGLTFTSKNNLKTLVNLVTQTHLDIGQLIFKKEYTNANQEKTSDVTTFYPFTLDYSLTENGSMKLSTSPIKLTNSAYNTVVSIKRIIGSGDDLKLDSVVGKYLGSSEYVIDTININNEKLPVPIVINGIHITSDLEKEHHLYDTFGSIKVNLDGESISKAIGIKGLELEDAGVDIHSKNVSALTVQLLQQLANLSNPSRQAVEDKIHTIFTEIVNNGSSAKVNLALDTDQGNATLVASIKAKSGSANDTGTWLAVLKSHNSLQLLNILRHNFAFDIKLTIPTSLVNAAGLEQIMSIGTGYIVKDDENYFLHIENTDKGIKLNGNLLPLPDNAP